MRQFQIKRSVNPFFNSAFQRYRVIGPDTKPPQKINLPALRIHAHNEFTTSGINMRIASKSTMTVLAFLALCTPAMAQTDASQTLDIQTKGPYAQRPFARIPGAQVTVQNATPPPSNSGQLHF